MKAAEWLEQEHVVKILKADTYGPLCLSSIRVVVEDKETSGGAFSMKVSPTATIERLQQEVTSHVTMDLFDHVTQ